MTTAVSTLPELSASINDSEQKAYYPALDGLRAIAVLLVFGAHYCHFPMGWAGVDLFFVLSGFLITGILWNTRAKNGRLRAFYMKRVLRIFPLYYGVFFVLILCTPWLHLSWDRDDLSWLFYLGNWTRYIDFSRFTSAHVWGEMRGFSDRQSLHSIVLCVGHFWSLCVEEQFYLFWPFLMYWFGSRRRILQVCAGVVLAMPFVRFAAERILPFPLIAPRGEILYHFTLFRIDALLLGAFLSLALGTRFRPKIERLAQITLTTLGIIALMLLLPFLLNPAAVPHLSGAFDFRRPWMSVWGLSLVDLAAGSLIVLSLKTGTTLFGILSLSPLRWLGIRSYGFYVYHYLLMVEFQRLFQKSLHPMPYSAACAFLFTLTLCWLSFRYIETPFLRMKDKFDLGVSHNR